MPISEGGTIVRGIAWPVALILIAQRVFFLALDGTPTDDFTTVYSAIRRMLDGQPVYEQAYNHVDPLYLYTPGATALLTPLGLLPFDAARTGFIVVNALAIIAALAILTRIVGRSLRDWLWPASIAVAFATEAVTNTLAFSNINGLLLLALSGFLWAFLRGHESHSAALQWTAGVIIGLAIIIKPQFAPVLLLPLVRLDWRGLAGGIAMPVLVNLGALMSLDSVHGYADKLWPYLKVTRDYANSSWPGARAYFEFGPGIYWAIWLGTAVLVAFTLIALMRWNRTDPALWAMSTTGVLFAGVFFLSNLGQQYYSMWLFPLMFTALLPASVFHTWPAWLGATLYLAPVTWTSEHFPNLDRWLGIFAGTIGWFLIIVVCAATVAGWLVQQTAGTKPAAHDVSCARVARGKSSCTP